MHKIILFVFILLLSSCDTEIIENIGRNISWDTRQAKQSDYEGFRSRSTYLPIYSHIYSENGKSFNLTVTISVRNVSAGETLYLTRADYYNTDGKLVKKYLTHPICVKPLETIEFLIDETDSKGGSGANFIFDWAKEKEKNPPLFEAVMISTNSQQGLSFTSRGIPLEP